LTEIPERVIERIRSFIREGCTGSVVLHFNRGHVQAYEVHEKESITRIKTVDTPHLTPTRT